MIKIGIIGWRGLVGTVLMGRMREEDDLRGSQLTFFSTSAVGGRAPKDAGEGATLADAYDISSLSNNDVLISCQGGDYTNGVFGKLRESGWRGYWIDAASALRMQHDSTIVLDPINKPVIEAALAAGKRDFIGGNCTVSLMLMALGGLVKAGLVEWIHTSTYQAVSGAGAKQMKELLCQQALISEAVSPHLEDPAATAVSQEEVVSEILLGGAFPTEHIGAPLATSLLPWIDREVDGGQTREEWKGMVETNKILQTSQPIVVDGICVRVPVLRCHSQSFLIKLRSSVSISEIEQLIASDNPWVRFVPNTKEDSLSLLTPAAVSGKLHIPIGRVRKAKQGEQYFTAFSVGDQLLWGAAEPLRRVLNMVREHLGR